MYGIQLYTWNPPVKRWQSSWYPSLDTEWNVSILCQITYLQPCLFCDSNILENNFLQIVIQFTALLSVVSIADAET